MGVKINKKYFRVVLSSVGACVHLFCSNTFFTTESSVEIKHTIKKNTVDY